MILFSSIHIFFLFVFSIVVAWTLCVPLKGALYCLLGNPIGVCLANLHDWECIAVTWPAIVRSGLSSAMSLEKPSIVRLFDDLADKIHRHYETIGIDFSVNKTHYQHYNFITVHLNYAIIISHSWTSNFGGFDPLLFGHWFGCWVYSYHFLSR